MDAGERLERVIYLLIDERIQKILLEVIPPAILQLSFCQFLYFVFFLGVNVNEEKDYDSQFGAKKGSHMSRIFASLMQTNEGKHPIRRNQRRGVWL